MNYEIALYNFFNDGAKIADYDNHTRYIEENGINRFIYNMENLWAYDLRGYPGFEADGKCVFIRYQ